MHSNFTHSVSSRGYSAHVYVGKADLPESPVKRPPRGMSVLNKILAGKYDFMAHHRKTSEREQVNGNPPRPEMKR